MVPLKVLLHILANLSNPDLRTITQQKLGTVCWFNCSSCHPTEDDYKRVFSSITAFSALDGGTPAIKF